MDPFDENPETDWPEALALLATSERAYKAQYPEDPIDDDWTVIIQQSGRQERAEVPVNVRGWVVMAHCYVFARWLLSGTDLLEARLAKYPTLADWVEHEVHGRRLAVDDSLTQYSVVPTGFGEILYMAVLIRFLAALELPAPTVGEGDPATVEAEEVTMDVFNRLQAYAGSLTPREAWEGIGAAVQRAAEDDDYVRHQRIAYRYTREHFAEWVDTVPNAAQGEAMAERLRHLLPTMTKDEREAMIMWGVDRAINVPDDVWMQIQFVLDDEFEKILAGPLEMDPEDDGLGYGTFSVN